MVLAVATVVSAVTEFASTGKGAISVSGQTWNIQFKAGIDTSADPDTIWGEVQQSRKIPGAADLKWHGTVQCYDQKDNEAELAGIVDSSNVPGIVANSTFFHVGVIDNGEGGGATPDEYGVVFDDDDFCPRMAGNVQTDPILRGNIQVH